MIQPLLVIIHDFPKFITGSRLVARFAFAAKAVAKVLVKLRFNTKVASFKIHDIIAKTILKGKTTSKIAMKANAKGRTIITGTVYSNVASTASASAKSIIKAKADMEKMALQFTIDDLSIRQYQIYPLRHWDDFTLEELDGLMLGEMDDNYVPPTFFSLEVVDNSELTELDEATLNFIEQTIS